MTKFERLRANAGEHFSDYLIIVCDSDGVLTWGSSEKTFAMGAASRYLNACNIFDQYEHMQNMKRRDDGC